MDVLRHAAVLTAFLLFGEQAVADSNELAKRFFREAPAGWKVLEEWDSALDVAGHLTVRIRLPGKEEVPYPDEERFITYRRRAGCLLTERHKSAPRAGEPPWRVLALNPRYTFVLDGVAGDGSDKPVWQVAGINLQDQESMRRDVWGLIGTHLCPAYTLGNKRLSEVFEKKPESCVSNVHIVHGPHGDACELTYHPEAADDPKNKAPLPKGMTRIPATRMVFDLANHWALIETEGYGEYEKGKKIGSRHTITYGDQRLGEGYPYVRSEIRAVGPGGARTETFEYTRIDRNDLAERDFTLAAFGFDEPNEPTSNPRRFWLVATLLVAGAACAVLAITLRRRRRRT